MSPLLLPLQLLLWGSNKPLELNQPALKRSTNRRKAGSLTSFPHSTDAGTLGVPLGEPGVSGDFWVSLEGRQGPFRPSGWNRGLPLRRRRGQGPHLATFFNASRGPSPLP